MKTLRLVAPGYRETATLIPIFDYDAQEVGDIRGALLQAYGQRYGAPDAGTKEEVIVSADGGEPPVRALLYKPNSGAARGAVLHMHGGGWIAGTADMMAGFCAALAERHGVVVLSVDYRLASEANGDAALDDCFAALSWLRAEMERLGMEPDRIALIGDSAGGSLAAGLALLARDAGIRLAGQLLIYPALDDRTGIPRRGPIRAPCFAAEKSFCLSKAVSCRIGATTSYAEGSEAGQAPQAAGRSDEPVGDPPDARRARSAWEPCGQGRAIAVGLHRPRPAR